MRVWAVLLSICLALSSVNVHAKRLGGGKSFGTQSANVTRQAAPPAAPGQNAMPAQSANVTRPATANTPVAPTATPQRKPWAGMLGGIAAGLGLAWLANSLGMGEAFGNILLMGMLVMAALFVWRMFQRSRTAGAAPARGDLAYQGAAASPRSYSPQNVGNDASARPWEAQSVPFQGNAAAPAAGSMIGSALAGSQNWGVPSGFDVEGFLSAAKRNFLTLQDAWDKGDITSLRAMMTDEMLTEIKAQLAEREAQASGVSNKTEVAMLEARLLGIEEQTQGYLASVEFSGMVREDAAVGPGPFREVWNMYKPRNGGAGWLVAGVQAMQ